MAKPILIFILFFMSLFPFSSCIFENNLYKTGSRTVFSCSIFINPFSHGERRCAGNSLTPSSACIAEGHFITREINHGDEAILEMVIRVWLSDICQVLDLMGTKMIFYPWVALVSDPNRDGYFFSPADKPTGTRYFTTTIILGCEQVKNVLILLY
jgi:hypothetical protein